ncbi:MAG: recombinase family protein [Deltaproteobacteria bacterium]|nr:recombinase family protein [Deltaproteobacteria bacterium]
MEAIIINRVSDAHQKEGYSLDEQERLGKQYADDQGFRVLRAFTFQETASKVHQRKKFDEIVAFIAAHTSGKQKALAVVAEKHDRLYRNHTNKAQLQLFIEEGKIEIHLYKERKTITKDSPPSDFLVDDMMTSVNAFTSRNIGRETKKGLLGKARDGWFPGKAPFGYINAHPELREDKNRRRGIIKPLTWGEALIPRMYDLRSQGFSFDRVRGAVLEEGLVPVDKRPTFHKSTVEKILKNPFYMGEFDWSGERHQGKHTPLVSKSLWKTVQETFWAHFRPGFRARHKNGSLSGFMKCACGCSVTYDPKDKPSGRHYDYYRCSNGKKQHAKLRYVSEGHIFQEFKPALDSIHITEKRADEVMHVLNETEEKARRAHDRNIEAMQARLKEMESAEDLVYDDFRKGVLDEVAYKRQIERVRKERHNLTAILGEAQQEVTGAVLVTAKKIFELAQKAPDLYLRATHEERRGLLTTILSNPILDGLSVRYELKRPFRLVAEMASSCHWGG